jgi:hypothetical protein
LWNQLDVVRSNPQVFAGSKLVLPLCFARNTLESEQFRTTN